MYRYLLLLLLNGGVCLPENRMKRRKKSELFILSKIEYTQSIESNTPFFLVQENLNMLFVLFFFYIAASHDSRQRTTGDKIFPWNAKEQTKGKRANFPACAFVPQQSASIVVEKCVFFSHREHVKLDGHLYLDFNWISCERVFSSSCAPSHVGSIKWNKSIFVELVQHRCVIKSELGVDREVNPRRSSHVNSPEMVKFETNRKTPFPCITCLFLFYCFSDVPPIVVGPIQQSPTEFIPFSMFVYT